MLINIEMEQENEEMSLSDIKNNQFKLLQEKRSLVDNYEAIKTKIDMRM